MYIFHRTGGQSVIVSVRKRDRPESTRIDNVFDHSGPLTLECQSDLGATFPINGVFGAQSFAEAHVSKRAQCINSRLVFNVTRTTDRIEQSHLNKCQYREHEEQTDQAPL